MRFNLTPSLFAFQALLVSAVPTQNLERDGMTIVERHDMSYGTSPLHKRACWQGDFAGCTKGYCWKRCGSNLPDGKWCWLAERSDGTGPWVKCYGDPQAA